MDYISYISDSGITETIDKHLQETEYRLNDSPDWSMPDWWWSWPKNRIIHRIRCRNVSLFGDQAVWEEIWDPSKDVEPSEIVRIHTEDQSLVWERSRSRSHSISWS